MTPSSPARALAALGTAAVLLAGCSATGVATDGPAASGHITRVTPSATAPGETPPAPPRPGATVAPWYRTAATAVVAAVEIHEVPDGPALSTLPHPQPSGAPLTFLVVESRDGWHQVQLPQRPNGSTGWIRAEAVTLAALEYSVTVSVADNTLSLHRGGAVEQTFSVATGTGDTPTPLGSFYLTELLAPTNAGYGPFAFGISAFSDVLNSFGAGPGQIGLHGTDDASSIGRAASHGCIRMSNEDISVLANLLPLGTPITIS
jgi:lipoprotein-anchoring transpeptidase ErfK/SrfK